MENSKVDGTCLKCKSISQCEKPHIDLNYCPPQRPCPIFREVVKNIFIYNKSLEMNQEQVVLASLYQTIPRKTKIGETIDSLKENGFCDVIKIDNLEEVKKILDETELSQKMELGPVYDFDHENYEPNRLLVLRKKR